MTDQIASESIANTIVASAAEVFSSMLASELADLNQSACPVDSPCDGVLSVVGLTGSWVGSGYLICSTATARLLASRFLMSDMECGVNDDVLDAIGEITNMIIGSVKNSLEESLGPMQLSVPTVIHGKNISTHFMKSELAATVTCGAEDWSIVLRICLTKAGPVGCR